MATVTTRANGIVPVLIWQNLGAYHKARILELGRRIKHLHVIEISSTMDRYPWEIKRDFEHVTFITLFQEVFEKVPQKDILKSLKTHLIQIDPEVVVIPGITEVFYRDIAFWCRQHGIKVVSIMISTLLDRRRYWFKEIIKRILYQRSVDAVAASGMRSVEYSQALGFDLDRIWRIGNVVSNDTFAEKAEEARKNPEKHRAEFDLPERYFLSIGRLDAKKNLLFLIDAFERYRKRGGEWNLVMVGRGPQKNEIHEYAKRLPDGSIHFIDWLQIDELPYVYALGGAFALASTSEPWGLVVNEAMACGLPVLVSRACGCQPELCRRGLNGFDFDPRDLEALTRAMTKVAAPGTDRATMGRWSETIIQSFTPQSWASVMTDCILTVTSGQN